MMCLMQQVQLHRTCWLKSEVKNVIINFGQIHEGFGDLFAGQMNYRSLGNV